MAEKVHVAILDDHQSVVDGYLYRLSRNFEIEVVATLAYGEALAPALAKNRVDVLLLDFSVPSGPNNPNLFPTLTEIPKLLQLYPNLDILVISMFGDRGLIRAVMEAGASGYIFKDDSAAIQDLGNIIMSMADGGIYLSPKAGVMYQRTNETSSLSRRQLEALLLCACYPNSKTTELAEMMVVSNSTVRNLLSDTYLKLGVHTRAAAIEKARQSGLLSTDVPTAPRL